MKKMLLVLGVILALDSTNCYASSRRFRPDSDIGSLTLAVELFEDDVGRLPNAEEGLQALVACPEAVPLGVWNGPYLKHGLLPIDPWKHSYIYCYPESRGNDGFGIYSLGADGMSLTAGDDRDDVNNWNQDKPWRRYYRRYDVWRTWGRRAVAAGPALAVVVPSVLLAYVLLKSRRRRRLTGA